MTGGCPLRRSVGILTEDSLRLPSLWLTVPVLTIIADIVITEPSPLLNELLLRLRLGPLGLSPLLLRLLSPLLLRLLSPLLRLLGLLGLLRLLVLLLNSLLRSLSPLLLRSGPLLRSGLLLLRLLVLLSSLLRNWLALVLSGRPRCCRRRR